MTRIKGKFPSKNEFYDAELALEKLTGLFPKRNEVDAALDLLILKAIEDESVEKESVTVFTLCNYFPSNLKHHLTAIYNTNVMSVLNKRCRKLEGKGELCSDGPSKYKLSPKYFKSRAKQRSGLGVEDPSRGNVEEP